MLTTLSHAGLPVVLGVDLIEKPLMMVTLFLRLNEINITFKNILTVDEDFHAVKKLDRVCWNTLSVSLVETLFVVAQQTPK